MRREVNGRDWNDEEGNEMSGGKDRDDGGRNGHPKIFEHGFAYAPRRQSSCRLRHIMLFCLASVRGHIRPRHVMHVCFSLSDDRGCSGISSSAVSSASSSSLVDADRSAFVIHFEERAELGFKIKVRSRCRRHKGPSKAGAGRKFENLHQLSQFFNGLISFICIFITIGKHIT